jgi:hypothetical protein
MVKHHILIGLGFKKQNFRNRGIRHMLNRAGKVILGAALPQNQMTIMPVSRPPPKVGGAVRRPLKFNY